ncbi:hypothetical protein T02_5062 [Trichinella nativa]|uniref:Uncharacterized protein n=1 Tax=Trichinella nativa TaxID=6335 RepID=A0A0V1KNQ2_9BILA|nr:hypothetical protein T02_5062 [Trichinella nativa]
MTVQRNPPVNTCATPPRDGRDGSPVGVTNKPARQSCSLQKHMLNAQYVVIDKIGCWGTMCTNLEITDAVSQWFSKCGSRAVSGWVA